MLFIFISKRWLIRVRNGEKISFVLELGQPAGEGCQGLAGYRQDSLRVDYQRRDKGINTKQIVFRDEPVGTDSFLGARRLQSG